MLFLSAIYFLNCTDESSMTMEEDMEMEIDSFKYLTPCLIDIVKNYNDYVNNDSITGNEDYDLERIFRLQVDSNYYYWLQTDWEDETEYIYSADCNLVCKYNGWTSFSNDCLQEFRDSIWSVVWQR
ncbi:MAG: hypothetical protein R2788_17245 [Saprospiraceae bacterium]